MKKISKTIISLLILLQLTISSSFGAPQQFTKTVNFGESTNRSPSSTVYLKDLGEVVSVTTNTGSVTYSVSGENVTVRPKNGSSTRTESYTPSRSASDSKTSSSNSFSSSMSYSSGGYSGTLYKDGSSYQYLHSPADYKYVSETRYNSKPWGKYRKTETGWTIIGAGNPQLPNTIYYNSGGYSGALYKNSSTSTQIMSSEEQLSSYEHLPVGSTTPKLYELWSVEYEGTVISPAVYRYKQDYSGTVYGATQYTYYYAYNVTITYTKRVFVPTTPTSSNITNNQIKVNWTSNGNETGTTYQLYCSNTGSIIYSGTSTSYTHTGLTPNTNYNYKVRATSPSGSVSDYSSVMTATTLAANPTANGFDSVTTNSLRIKWLHNGNPTDTAYQYIVKTPSTNAVVKSGWVTGTNVTVSGLSPNRSYNLYVKSRNRLSVANSTEIYVGKAYTLANVPSSLSITNPTQTSLKISWAANGNPSGTTYKLINLTTNRVVYQGSETTYTDNNLTSDKSYIYQVKSINLNNVESASTGSASKYTLPYNINSNGITSKSSSAMTGNIISSNTSSGIRYYYEIVNESGFTVKNSGWITAKSYAFTGLLPNHTYKVYAMVKNDSGSLSRILIDEQTTIANVPGTPERSASSTRLKNIFTFSPSSNPSPTTKYEVYIKPLNGVYSKYVTTTSASFTHTYSTWNSFYYKVRAINKSGEASAFSPEYFYTDLVNPIGTSIIINNNDIYTNNSVLSLSLQATDDLSGVYKMRFKTGSGSWSSWRDYSTTHTYQIPSSVLKEGTTTVYVQFQDMAGNISNSISDSIIYDSVKPTGTLSYPERIIKDHAITVSVSSTDLNPSSADYVSGLDKIRFRELENGVPKTTWTAWENPVNFKFWEFTPGDGEKTIEMEVRDRAGNIENTKLDLIVETLFIIKAEFTDIVSSPLNNPVLPTSEMVNIKRGYNFTIIVETEGNPNYVKWTFNRQSGNFEKIADNLFKITLNADKDSEAYEILPINIEVHRSLDSKSKYATLKVNVVGDVYDDFNTNNTN